jgi:hypothetical protein
MTIKIGDHWKKAINRLKRNTVAGLKNFQIVVHLLSSWLIFAPG